MTWDDLAVLAAFVAGCIIGWHWKVFCDSPSESKPSEAGAREATVSGPTAGSPERERGDQTGPESQQPCSPPEAGAERERAKLLPTSRCGWTKWMRCNACRVDGNCQLVFDDCEHRVPLVPPASAEANKEVDRDE